MTEEELIDKFGNEEIYNKGNYSDFIDRDTMAKNDFYHYKKGYELGIKELETTKRQLEELQTFLNRFQEEFYLNNSASGLSKLYADIVEYDLNKLKSERGE